MSYGTYGRIICWQYHPFKESLDEKKMFDNKTIEEIFKVSQYKKKLENFWSGNMQSKESFNQTNIEE